MKLGQPYLRLFLFKDWLGVKLVLAESFERIHRSNLIGMGVLLVEFMNQQTVEKLDLLGIEKFSLRNLEKTISPGCELELEIECPEKGMSYIKVLCRIDTNNELEYYRNGGILNYVLRTLINDSN